MITTIFKNKIYKRFENLHNKLWKVMSYSNKLTSIGVSRFNFNSNLGERQITFNWYDCWDYDYFQFNYMIPVNNEANEVIFSIYSEKHKIEIYCPEYKVGEKQITPEEISLAILELEEHVNSLYPLYLRDAKYHKEQEKLLEKF